MRKLAFVALSLALAGCQTMGLSGETQSEPAVEAQMPVPAVAAPPASVATAANNGMLGMTADALQAAWGEPSLKRTEMGAEMWQYGGRGNCTLLVYFYAAASNVMTVKHAEAVPGGADDDAIANCAKAAGKPSLKPVS